MKCPFCAHVKDKVVDSRESGSGDAIRRRRECLECGRRFTSYERIEEIPYLVIKKDGRREPFNRNKILEGLVRACQKRSVGMLQLESLVDEVEKEIQKKYDREIDAKIVGQMVVERLSKLDDVAYVRFASVYRQFKDVNEFMKELKEILSKRR